MHGIATKPFTTTLVGLAIVVPTFLVGFVLLGNPLNPLIKAIGFMIGVASMFGRSIAGLSS